jgi:hypothetical protein
MLLIALVINALSPHQQNGQRSITTDTRLEPSSSLNTADQRYKQCLSYRGRPFVLLIRDSTTAKVGIRATAVGFVSLQSELFTDGDHSLFSSQSSLEAYRFYLDLVFACTPSSHGSSSNSTP